MRIAVLGTGMVGRTLAAGLQGQGHDVVIGTRDVAQTMARTEADAMGTPPLSQWLADHEKLRLLTYPEAGGFAELLVNATHGAGSLAALTAAGAADVPSRIIIDVANPLDFSQGFPPTLWVKDDDSLGEQIQQAFPAASVVKTLNTVTAAVMVAPQLVPGGATTIFLCGDSAAAKSVVRGILESFGWSDVLDLGGIAASRGPEMYLPLWLRILGAVNSPLFNVRVTR